MRMLLFVVFFFFFNDTATTEIYTLPYTTLFRSQARVAKPLRARCPMIGVPMRPAPTTPRSEEHTSELQSPCNLVCRLLLEKKKKDKQHISCAVSTAYNTRVVLHLLSPLLQLLYH